MSRVFFSAAVALAASFQVLKLWIGSMKMYENQCRATSLLFLIYPFTLPVFYLIFCIAIKCAHWKVYATLAALGRVSFLMAFTLALLKINECNSDSYVVTISCTEIVSVVVETLVAISIAQARFTRESSRNNSDDNDGTRFSGVD